MGILSPGYFRTLQGGSSVQPFLQSVINASADGASVNFTETVALTDPVFNQQLVFSQLDCSDQVRR